MYEYRAKLIKIIDGDTIDAEIDLGFKISVRKRIRFLGINAPETRTRDLEEKQAGLKTKSRLETLFDTSRGVFTLKSHGVGKFGRVLGEIFIENININELLLKEGLASKY
jgi:micrococcal nuclease